MPKLFEPTEIQGMKLANRFVRSATWEGMAADDGACTPALLDCMTALSRGGLGLIITSHAYILRNGQAGPRQLGAYSDDLLPGLREMTQAVHAHGTPVALQLAHAGFLAFAKATGEPPMAPSVVEGFSKGEKRQMTEADIQAVVEAFGQGARRAKAAGFDAVQIHAAHGYLLSQFLSPAFNKRTDGYGGALENRARPLMQVLASVRRAVGNDYPVLIKMNSRDFLEGGLDIEDSLAVGRMLQEGGIDAVELSGGTLVSGKYAPSRPGIRSPEKEAYFEDAAKAFKDNLRVPLILVGGIRSIEVAERLLKEGTADFFSMSRPLIREPDLVKRWKSGDRRAAACLSDNMCFDAARSGKGLYCVTEEKEKERTG
jgi:2,4-dienoyl-CoA reductase-like NADH-dependent reductase (Old Yellow Enzyme family)